MLLINIKAFDKIFVNKKFVKLYKLSIILLQNSINYVLLTTNLSLILFMSLKLLSISTIILTFYNI